MANCCCWLGEDKGSANAEAAEEEEQVGPCEACATRTQSTLDKVADDIRSAGGSAQTAVVDAFDQQQVYEHARSVVDGSGSLDVSFNLISRPDYMGTPVVEMCHTWSSKDPG